MIKSKQIDALKKKIGKAYFCNCLKCERLHIWSKKTAKDMGMGYICYDCGLYNGINGEDLM